MQRVYEWRGTLAKTALDAVAEFFEADKENFANVEDCAAFAKQVLGKGLLFRYREYRTNTDGQVVSYRRHMVDIIWLRLPALLCSILRGRISPHLSSALLAIISRLQESRLLKPTFPTVHSR